MAQTFHRDRFTWLAYLLFAFFAYFLNILGPITPFLKDELRLTYTVRSGWCVLLLYNAVHKHLCSTPLYNIPREGVLRNHSGYIIVRRLQRSFRF